MKPPRIREILTSEANRLRAVPSIQNAASDDPKLRQAGYALLDYLEYASDESLIIIRDALMTNDRRSKLMTPLQRELWARIAQYSGQGPIMIATSRHAFTNPDSGIYAEGWKPVAYAQSGTLHGMVAKGKIRIVATYWRGATIEVL